MKLTATSMAARMGGAVILLTILCLLCVQPALAEEKTMIAEGSKVTLEYTLSLKDVGQIESNVGGEPLQFVIGQKQVVAGLEKGLVGLAAGDEKKIEIAPKDAYGPVYEDVIVKVPAEKFPDELKKVGGMVQTMGPGGKTIYGKVLSVTDKEVTVDFNHPMAGKTLYFDVKVLDVE